MEMEKNEKICLLHDMRIEYICLFIAKQRNEKKCENRFLCSICKSEANHDSKHSKFTLKLDQFIEEDNSLTFFELFFTAPQIKTLFYPLKINYELILAKLKELTLKLHLSNSQSKSTQPISILQTQQQSSSSPIMKGSEIHPPMDSLQINSFIDTYNQKIQYLSERINLVIERIHAYYRDQFELDSFIQILRLYYKENKITMQVTNEIINKSMQWIHCTQIFMKNVYVVEDNLNLAETKLAQNGNLTDSDLLSFYKFARKELFINLNHLRGLFQTCQVSQLELMEKQLPLPHITYFPLQSKRFLPTVSMSESKNIKITNNQVLIVRDYETLVLQINTSTCLTKLLNVIYSKKIIKDAALSLCDSNQLTLLFEDNTIGIYQIKPYISVLDNEQISLMEFGNEKCQIINIDYIKPQRIQDKTETSNVQNNNDDEMIDYVALKTSDMVFLLDSLEWSFYDQFPNNHELIKFIVQNDEDEEENQTDTNKNQDDSDLVMCVEKNNNNNNKKKSVICFRYDEQIDFIHYENSKVFESNQIKSYAYSPDLQHFIYVTENDLIIFNKLQDGPIIKQNRNKVSISCMDYTADHTYLFILYSNSTIQFYYTFDNYELEFETHLWKNGTSIKKAVYSKLQNVLYLLSNQGHIFNINLSSPKIYY